MSKTKNAILLSLFIHMAPLATMIPLLSEDKKDQSSKNEVVSVEYQEETKSVENKEPEKLNVKRGSSSYSESQDSLFTNANEIKEESSNSSQDTDSKYYYGIGIEFDQNPTFATVESQRLMGFQVKKVFSQYSGANSGIKENDVVLKVDGKSMNKKIVFSENQIIKLLVLRNNKIITLSVSVMKIPIS